jgi:hypothetical protein
MVYGIICFKEKDGSWSYDEEGLSKIAATKVQEVVGELPEKDWGKVKTILKKDNTNLM